MPDTTQHALPKIPVIDLGRMDYAAAYELQVQHLDEVLAERCVSNERRAGPGRLLVVEHNPVITLTRRPGVRENLLATLETLAEHGLTLAETDRGGDITYHGPGQIVVYPILDLNTLNLGLHDYMSLLESAVIDTCRNYGIGAERDRSARGVWVVPRDNTPAAKVCAMGVRVRRWVTMHGLALNVSPTLEHFNLIVPCGLAGRSVTSMAALLGERCPSVAGVKRELVGNLVARITLAWQRRARPPSAR